MSEVHKESRKRLPEVVSQLHGRPADQSQVSADQNRQYSHVVERRPRKAGQGSSFIFLSTYILSTLISFFSSFFTFCVPCASKSKNCPLLVVARFQTLSPPPWSLLQMRPRPRGRTASGQSSTLKRS